MKTSNDVFFFVLVDFLAQALFVFLLVVGIQRHRNGQHEREAKRAADVVHHVDQALTAAGVSDLTELTDQLTKLSPTHDLPGTAEFVSSSGGIRHLREQEEIIRTAGGKDEVLKKLQAYGLPPCLKDASGRPIALATVEVHDDSVVVSEPTESWRELVRRLGPLPSAHVSLATFLRHFEGLKQLKRSCQYHVRVRACTKLARPLEEVQRIGFGTFGYSRC